MDNTETNEPDTTPDTEPDTEPTGDNTPSPEPEKRRTMANRRTRVMIRTPTWPTG